MKKKLFALILVLLMVPAVIALGAQPGYAESQTLLEVLSPP